ncbi:MAG: hypothetical protein JNM48_12475, partial [Rhodospirillales bacterium]|nr:hypothetical protein [Rhodospirillales bacterium]
MTAPLAPPRPVGRNWRSIGIAAGVAGMCTAAFAWYSIAGKNEKPAPRAERSDFTHTQTELPARSFDVGYRLPELLPPPPVAAPLPAKPVPVQAPLPLAQKAADAKPPKPMLSMFATAADPTAFAPTDEVGGAAALARPGVEHRPGMSDGVDRLDPDQRQGQSAQKNRWLANAGTGGDDTVT